MAPASDLAQGLFTDVQRYESFGLHRFGSPGAEAALDWIANELANAGMDVSSQLFRMDRQYDCQSGSLSVNGHRLAVLPQWWPPDAPRLNLSAAIAPDGLEYMTMPFDGSAYLNDGHRAKILEACARGPKAVLLSIDHPTGEIFTYNVNQKSAAWPVPVILVAPKDRTVLEAASRTRSKVDIAISGRYQRDLEGRNIVGRLDRGKGKWLVISTPVTSWFTSTCERGPGIAGFLAIARGAAKHLANVDTAFVATAGHEIGHGGMEHFLRKEAPPPGATLAWAHFGSSLACHDSVIQTINSSVSLSSLVDRHFANIKGTRRNGERAREGELRNVHGAGYANFFGMAGSHKSFHTAADTLTSLSAEKLTQMVLAFSAVLEEVASVETRPT